MLSFKIKHYLIRYKMSLPHDFQIDDVCKNDSYTNILILQIRKTLFNTDLFYKVTILKIIFLLLYLHLKIL